jgi:hypothetical protein
VFTILSPHPSEAKAIVIERVTVGYLVGADVIGYFEALVDGYWMDQI